jgi:tRNA U38,U39,U40 pseudouridine synthase TruA
MQAAAKLLVGTHDFTQFSNDSTERLKRNPVKTLQRYDVAQVGPSHVRLEVRQ